ncbi:MAG: hypothetical protein V4577_26445 [Bacteroidota bacterium]
MHSNLEYRQIFASNYNGSNIEEVMEILKTSGASQMDTLKVLMDELNFSITEADEIVLNSITWIENKEITLRIREGFADILKNSHSEN